MASLYITEFRGFTNDLPHVAGIVDQKVTIGASSAQSAAMDSATQAIRLHADAICSVAFGPNPTAAATNMRLAANESIVVTVPQNISFKVAVITNS